MSYVDLGYKPEETDLICEFSIEPGKGLGVKDVADKVAAESSTGTWVDVTTTKPYVKGLGARVFYIKGKTVKIAYPLDLFELRNVPQILSSVAGNIFGMKAVRNLRLEDIDFPERVIRSFRGPRFGIKGVRKLFGVERPLLGTIIKPKIGLRTEDHTRVAYDAWTGGCDIVKDDENLSNQGFNPFRRRVVRTLEMRNKAGKETGEVKAYMPNITAETREMLRRAEFVKRQGGKYIMVDVMTVGWSALQTLRDEVLGLIIHAHRAMHAAITRNKKHGISMLVVAKLARLIGVDQLHIGTIIGKMEGKRSEVTDIEDEIEERIIKPDIKNHVLAEDWFSIKPVFAVCSGGLAPKHVPRLVKMLGKDIIIQMGGGIHGNPKGSLEGARVARKMVDSL
ncbi:MAG: type III ribulose-bisphosphate carboxylase [Candidatus Aenigmatarchaeota archaeon]|nr:MAG: type III ribulose-bisphosphate carboxylase [Candidatus Aenigmarchaeota archaeon]